jgi:hypothetical protein
VRRAVAAMASAVPAGWMRHSGPAKSAGRYQAPERRGQEGSHGTKPGQLDGAGHAGEAGLGAMRSARRRTSLASTSTLAPQARQARWQCGALPRCWR